MTDEGLQDLARDMIILQGHNYARKMMMPFKRQSHKMVKHTQTVRRQFVDQLFECV